jgi:hypothetical protein
MKSLGARNYLLPVRINNGFIRNNHEVFWFSDRDTARCSNVFLTRSLGVGAANRKFLDVCRNFEPDVIALSSQDIIFPQTIDRARKMIPHLAVFQYCIDALYIPENLENARRKADVVDWSFVTTGGPFLSRIAGRRSKASFIPNPVDASIDRHRCHERSDQLYDVFFAGHVPSPSHPKDLRATAQRLIQERIPRARGAFFGHGGRPSIYGATFMRELGNAKIGLNFSHAYVNGKAASSETLYLYSSDRLGLYQGNGLLVFVPKVFKLAEIYGQDVLAEVEDADDFIDKLRYYLDNDGERQKVARAGYELGHREFNERLVSQYMIESTLGLPHSHRYMWPTRPYCMKD